MSLQLSINLFPELRKFTCPSYATRKNEYIGKDDFSGVTDREVINIAIKENRTILTFDRDYGELIFKHDYRPKNGVIYLRLNSFDPILPGLIIENILSRKDFNPENSLSVIDERSIRQRKYQ